MKTLPEAARELAEDLCEEGYLRISEKFAITQVESAIREAMLLALQKAEQRIGVLLQKEWATDRTIGLKTCVEIIGKLKKEIEA